MRFRAGVDRGGRHLGRVAWGCSAIAAVVVVVCDLGTMQCRVSWFGA